jgi:hypothetical protein
VRRIGILVFVFVLLGCEPVIRFNETGTLQANNKITLAFQLENVDPNSAAPQVKLFSRYDSTNVIKLPDKLELTDKNSYQLSVPSLSAGEYRLVIDIPYDRKFLGFKFGEHFTTATFDFTVLGSLPNNCFGYDSKDNKLMGWTVSGVFIDNQKKPLGSASCPGLFYVQHSWPYALNETVEGGSIFVPVSDNCFPKPGQQANAKSRWQFSFNSPELVNVADWQKLKRLQFRIATKNIPVIVRPEVHYSVGSRNMSTFGHKKLAPHYSVTGGQWTEVDHPVELPAEAKVTGLSIHVSGIPEQTVGTEVDSVYLDGVCPIK